MALLIMMRHGQSKWNKANRFTGWVDVPLSREGVDEALEGGQKIANTPIDIIYTSTLIRAQMTAMLAMIPHHSGKVPCIMHEEKMLQEKGAIFSETAEVIPVVEAWQLNERHYGELQGQNKDETRARFGADQVHIWRRSFDVPPPGGEALKDTAARTIPYFKEKIVGELEEGRNVFVAAHGNSLRAIVMELDGLSSEEVVKLEIPTGEPFSYSYELGTFVKL
jgi:2,3-bisphosphoglycerate-dependent phosphoglycerate mutase